MTEIRPKKVEEVATLLQEVQSWSDDELDDLPKFYRDLARELRALPQSGEE